MKNITFKNISSAMLVLSVPELRFRRELLPGRTIPISPEDYQELMFDPGINGLIEDHYLLVNGVEEGEQAAVVADVLTHADIEKMIDNLDITAFAKFIPTAKQAEKDSVIQLAVEKGVTNPAFVALIKKYCDIDVIQAISMKHQAEE